MPARAPKLVYQDEADAIKDIAAFETLRQSANEFGTAVDRLRDAYNAYYDARLKAEPLWDGVLEDGEHGKRLVRNEQPFGHYYAVRDMPNEMILWLAEHGCLEAVNKAVDVFMDGDAPPRELIDIKRFKHDKSRVSLAIESTRAEASA